MDPRVPPALALPLFFTTSRQTCRALGVRGCARGRLRADTSGERQKASTPEGPRAERSGVRPWLLRAGSRALWKPAALRRRGVVWPLVEAGSERRGTAGRVNAVAGGRPRGVVLPPARGVSEPPWATGPAALAALAVRLRGGVRLPAVERRVEAAAEEAWRQAARCAASRSTMEDSWILGSATLMPPRAYTPAGWKGRGWRQGSAGERV